MHAPPFLQAASLLLGLPGISLQYIISGAHFPSGAFLDLTFKTLSLGSELGWESVRFIFCSQFSRLAPQGLVWTKFSRLASQGVVCSGPRICLVSFWEELHFLWNGFLRVSCFLTLAFVCTLCLGLRTGSCDISVHLELLLAEVVDPHLLWWQCWATVLTHCLENQGQVSAVSTELLSPQITFGGECQS